MRTGGAPTATPESGDELGKRRPVQGRGNSVRSASNIGRLTHLLKQRTDTLAYEDFEHCCCCDPHRKAAS
jgi:hypothetical protein